MKKICVAGKIGSVKSTLINEIAKHAQYQKFSFSDALKKYCLENQMVFDRKSLPKVGKSKLEDLGHEGLVKWAISFFDEIDWNGKVIIDGIRNKNIY